MLDVAGDGIVTSGADDPVKFDIDADGSLNLMGWLARGSDDAFLWRDVEHNHRVDDGSELFGVGMTLPDGRKAANGFEALAAYDAVWNGGNGDGEITAADRIWHRLRLWVDRDHDGISGPREIRPIDNSCVDSLSLSWVSSAEVDPAGNQFRMVSSFACRTSQNKRHTVSRGLVDIFFHVFR